MKFSNFSTGLTYADVQVGLDPSEGSGLVTLDADCNGVFKITNKATQKLKVVQSDGEHTLTQAFDLSGLTLGPTANTVSPTSATFDLNTSGANYGDKVYTVTPRTTGATINKVYFIYNGEPTELPREDQGIVYWRLDNSGLVITLIDEVLLSIGEACQLEHISSIGFYLELTDNSTVDSTVNFEDTTPVNIVSPATATYDLNASGANHKDLVFTVTPADPTATISKLYTQTGDSPNPSTDTEIPSSIGGRVLWTLDETGLVLTLIVGLLDNKPVGDMKCYMQLTDDSVVGGIITIEDTTPAENTVSPATVTYDKNASGANHKDLVFTVTPRTSGATVSKMYLQDGDTPDISRDEEFPSSADEQTMWSLDDSGLQVSIVGDAFAQAPLGTYAMFALLTDNTTVSVSIVIEDTT